MKCVAKIFRILVIVCVALTLTACGKISSPKPIEGSGYPHVYPRN